MRMGMRVCARVRRKYLFVINSCVPPLLNELQVCVRMRMRVVMCGNKLLEDRRPLWSRTSEGSRRADLEIRNIRLADKVDLLVDVTIRHDFIGAGRSGLTQGQLRNPPPPP